MFQVDVFCELAYTVVRTTGKIALLLLLFYFFYFCKSEVHPVRFFVHTALEPSS